MSIKELPKATCRLLSSSQVLTTPSSLVKELLDNALDAKATSVDIVITANTVDKIEVRDNGHGITSEDLNNIGKRGYTSKLRNFDELKTLGGLSLGFRGEALASAVELGDVSITTRVEGDIVATAIKLDVQGGIHTQTSTSHPVGTTICVSNLFSRLPVRKQTALKDPKKTILRIKEMLQSYALAKLNVRLTLKVLKAGNSNWSFAPRVNEGLKGIMSHVIGRETAAQCMELISTLLIPAQGDAGTGGLGDDTPANSNGRAGLETLPQSSFIIQAFLPRLDADLSKISGAQYISIDSRPVSSARGSPKKIICIYKTIISAMLIDGVSGKVKSPFIRLNIVCPTGSYDPNVEPAKDVVLFEDETVFLSLVEDWFKNIYGDRLLASTASKNSLVNQDEALEIARSTESVETLIANGDAFSSLKPGIEMPKPSNITDKDTTGLCNFISELSPDRGIMSRMGSPISPGTPHAVSLVAQPGSGFDMSEDCPDDEVELDHWAQPSTSDQATAGDGRTKQKSRKFDSLNPWLIAKLNAPVTKKKSRDSTLAQFAGDSTGVKPQPIPLVLSSPFRSSISRSSTEFHDHRPLGRRADRDVALQYNSQGSIEGWLRVNRELSRDNSMNLCDVSLAPPEGLSSVRAFEEVRDDGVDRGVSLNMLRSPPPTQAYLAAKMPQNVKRPFVSPLKVTPSVSQSAPEMRVKTLSPRCPQPCEDADMVFGVGPHDPGYKDRERPEVHEALDFERRKEEATRKLRQRLRLSQSSTEVVPTQGNERKTPSPNKKCHHTATAALESNQNHSTSGRMNDKIPIETCLPDDDPRAYLMRRQKSIAAYTENPSLGRKLKRTKTTLLPFETIPNKTELHGLCQLVSTDINLVSRALLMLLSHDQYVKSGIQAKALLMSNADMEAVKIKLEILVRNMTQVTASEEIDVALDFADLQGRSIADV